MGRSLSNQSLRTNNMTQSNHANMTSETRRLCRLCFQDGSVLSWVQSGKDAKKDDLSSQSSECGTGGYILEPVFLSATIIFVSD